MEDTYPGHFAYMSIHMRDCESQDLFNVFEASATFIHSGCRGGSKVLVHWYVHFFLCCALGDVVEVFAFFSSAVLGLTRSCVSTATRGDLAHLPLSWPTLLLLSSTRSTTH